jgi:hypothetical protein
VIRKKAAKKAPPRRATRTKAKPTAKVAVKPTPVSQRAQPEAIKPTPVNQRAQPEAIKPTSIPVIITLQSDRAGGPDIFKPQAS